MTPTSVRNPPHLSKISDYPVTGGVMVLAVLVTVVSWSDSAAVEALVMSPAAFHGEPWRLVTSMLPHGGLFHLGFNLYWVWRFGTVLEERLGSVAVGGFVMLLAAGSAVGEYALFYGGIGLSGVLYGLFGMLQVLKTRDPRFLGALDQGTVNLLVAWFFIAIALDVFNIMGIANGAHAAGWAVGAAVGLGVAAKHPRQQATALGLNLSWVVGLWLAAMVGLPVLNLQGLGDRDLRYRAGIAFDAGDPVEGLDLLEQVADYGATDRELWGVIAAGWDELGMPDRAAEAWARAGRVPEGEVAPPPPPPADDPG